VERNILRQLRKKRIQVGEWKNRIKQ
jgi:hypothetical protein